MLDQREIRKVVFDIEDRTVRHRFLRFRMHDQVTLRRNSTKLPFLRGQLQAQCASLPFDAFNSYYSAHRPHQPLRKCQTKTRSLDPGLLCTESIERCENTF